jgi:hypothetical protein
VDAAIGKRARRKSPCWWIRYYTLDGVRHRVKGYTDKKATETLAAELERKGIREEARRRETRQLGNTQAIRAAVR